MPLSSPTKNITSSNYTRSERTKEELKEHGEISKRSKKPMLKLARDTRSSRAPTMKPQRSKDSYPTNKELAMKEKILETLVHIRPASKRRKLNPERQPR